MNTATLQGKNIAFIAPDMFDYPREISNVLRSYGATVFYFKDRPQSLASRILRNASKQAHKKVTASFLGNIRRSLWGKRIDMVFVIKASAITPDFLDQLRTEHPGVHIIMYQWDIHTKYPYLHLVDHVDECYVFDRTDTVLHPKIKYLPLFFIDSYKALRKHNAEETIDLLHIGSFHVGKAAQIREINTAMESEGVSIYWYLVVTFSNWVRRMFTGEIYFKVRLKSLDTRGIIRLYRNSRAVLDLPQTGQKGLTMRTFEVLGAYKKLVTTNPTILQEKIYSKEMVYVLGHDDRPIRDFLDDSVELTEDMKTRIESYSIHNWVAQLLAGSA
jgi:hypothetical protein